MSESCGGGGTQTLLALYFARRVSDRDWNEPSFGSVALVLSVMYLVLVHVGNANRSTVLPRGPAIGYVMVLILFLAAAGYVWSRLKARPGGGEAMKPSWLLDVLAFGSLALFVGVGLFVARQPDFDRASASVIDMRAVGIVRTWTLVSFVGLLVYFASYRRHITT